nr:hypothetical protein [Pseudarthrobacter equi]
MVDDADHQEERRLEEAVGEQHCQAGQRGVRRAEAHHHGEEASWLTVP